MPKAVNQIKTTMALFADSLTVQFRLHLKELFEKLNQIKTKMA